MRGANHSYADWANREACRFLGKQLDALTTVALRSLNPGFVSQNEWDAQWRGEVSSALYVVLLEKLPPLLRAQAHLREGRNDDREAVCFEYSRQVIGTRFRAMWHSRISPSQSYGLDLEYGCDGFRTSAGTAVQASDLSEEYASAGFGAVGYGSCSADPSELLERAERPSVDEQFKQWLEENRAIFTRSQHLALYYVQVEGMSRTDAAEKMGISIANLDRHLEGALHRWQSRQPRLAT